MQLVHDRIRRLQTRHVRLLLREGWREGRREGWREGRAEERQEEEKAGTEGRRGSAAVTIVKLGRRGKKEGGRGLPG
jgi:hypothetical protein